MLQIRIDEELKNKASALYNELGMDLSTAVRMFLIKSLAVGGVPFEVTVSDVSLKAMRSADKMRTQSEQNGNSNMTLDEINYEIEQARKK